MIRTQPRHSVAAGTSTAPPMAHIPQQGDPDVALCGSSVTGIKAPDHTDRCVVCIELARSIWRACE